MPSGCLGGRHRVGDRTVAEQGETHLLPVGHGIGVGARHEAEPGGQRLDQGARTPVARHGYGDIHLSACRHRRRRERAASARTARRTGCGGSGGRRRTGGSRPNLNRHVGCAPDRGRGERIPDTPHLAGETVISGRLGGRHRVGDRTVAEQGETHLLPVGDSIGVGARHEAEPGRQRLDQGSR